jgi:hypothetical protein
MDLFAGERRHLDYIEGYLRAEDCHLASMFDVFTRLTRVDGKPPAEDQYLPDGPWREATFAWQRLRRCVIVTAALLMTALLAVVILSLT